MSSVLIKTTSWPEPRSAERYANLKQLMVIAEQMKEVGWRVDRDRIRYHLKACEERYQQYAVKLLELSGLPGEALGKAGTGGTARVRRYFLEDHGAPHVSIHKRTKLPQVNSAALTEWANKYRGKPYSGPAAALFALRKNKKYQSYCRAYLALSADDGRVHSNFFPFGAKTGRWTSGAKVRVATPEGHIDYGMNLQQVPQNEPMFDFGQGEVKLAESLRDVFVADEGCVVGSADFEALELRLIAYIFGVRGLIEQIEQGKDTHWINARALFPEENLPEEFDAKKHKRYRNAAKGCAYAFTYQYSDGKDAQYPTHLKKLQETFPTITMARVCKMAEIFFGLYPEIRAGQQEGRRSVSELGYGEIPISGRRLYYPDSMRGWNQRINSIFQSTGAELTNRATIGVAARADWHVGGFYILAQVHDELVVNVPKDRIEECGGIVTAAMGAPANFGGAEASIPAAIKFGPCWPK